MSALSAKQHDHIRELWERIRKAHLEHPESYDNTPQAKEMLRNYFEFTSALLQVADNKRSGRETIKLIKRFNEFFSQMFGPKWMEDFSGIEKRLGAHRGDP